MPKKNDKKKVKKKIQKKVGKVGTKKGGKPTGKKATDSKRPVKILKKTENDYEPINRWWEKENRNDNRKFDYLEHHGLMFGTDYEPHGMPVIHNGTPIVLPKEA